MRRCISAALSPFACMLLVVPMPALAGPDPSYKTHCAMCHGVTGAGVAGAFPRLTGRLRQIAATPEGREYLIAVLLGGLLGPIEVDGRKITGFMPRQAPLRDQDLADALNHLMALSPAKDAVKPFAAAEFARARQGKLRTPAQVAELRRALVTDGKVR